MNEEINQLYNEDIADRSNAVSEKQIDINDQKRLARVQKILEGTTDLEATDYHHAALIFQHGETLEHYKKAHELAMKAVELGDNSARWLAAASLDRSLLMEGKAQKYGTQFTLNDSNDWELALPIDPSVTDKEREEWNVPPLKDALKIYKQKYNL